MALTKDEFIWSTNGFMISFNENGEVTDAYPAISKNNREFTYGFYSTRYGKWESGKVPVTAYRFILGPNLTFDLKTKEE